jgi:hypothetical protein
VICIRFQVAVDKSVVVALAISVDFASFKVQVIVSQTFNTTSGFTVQKAI